MGLRRQLALAGVLAVTALAAGCEERRRAPTEPQAAETDAKNFGREAGEAVRNVGETVRDAAKGFEEGVGGSGTDTHDGVDVGQREGILNDGEGPIEENVVTPSERR